MPNRLIITNEQAENRATLLQGALAGSVLRLVKDFLPGPTTNRSNLVANECNFTGYPAGGYNLSAWVGPGLPGTGGAVITSPLVNVAPNVSNNVSNNVSGFWVETSGNSPLTYLCGAIDPPITVVSPTDQFPLIVQDYEGVTTG